MSGLVRKLKAPAIISLVLVLPFILLELINRPGFHDNFPIPLFGVMWLLPLSGILIGMSIVRGLGGESMANRFSFLVRVVLVIVIASFWVGLIRDQMPCFLGVPNCD